MTIIFPLKSHSRIFGSIERGIYILIHKMTSQLAKFSINLDTCQVRKDLKIQRHRHIPKYMDQDRGDEGTCFAYSSAFTNPRINVVTKKVPKLRPAAAACYSIGTCRPTKSTAERADTGRFFIFS